MNKLTAKNCFLFLIMFLPGCALMQTSAPAEIATLSYTHNVQPTPTYVIQPYTIYLRRTICFGKCPVYSIVIYGDGSVYYYGEKFVLVEGDVRSELPKNAAESLGLKINEVNYFNFDDLYVNKGVTDMPYAITTIMFEGKYKSIEHYLGDPFAPDGLLLLECAIDDIVDSYQWTGIKKEDSFCAGVTLH